MANIDDIFLDNEMLSNEELLRYVNEEISAEERQSLEQKISPHSFENDAIEGLQKVKDTNAINKQVELLNERLRVQLQNKRKPKRKKKINDLQIIILAVILLLFFCIISYTIIQWQHRSQQNILQKK